MQSMFLSHRAFNINDSRAKLHQRQLPRCMALADHHRTHELTLNRRQYLSWLIYGGTLADPPSSWASWLTDAAIDCDTIIPLEAEDGIFLVRFKIDGRPYRGVLDTGSPFLTVAAASGPATDPSCGYWGCWRGEGEPSGLEDTYEMFASQDGNVEWRRGRIEVDQITKIQELESRMGDQGTIFGVFTSRLMKGGAGDQSLVGLVRNTAAGIRPSFLGQSIYRSFSIHFPDSQLTLSQKSLIHKDETNWAPLVDLRKVGAPSQQYCVQLTSITVNGKSLTSLLPDGSPAALYGMIYSGSTGLFISERIFYSLQREAGGWRSVDLEFKTASGSTQRLSSSTSASDKFLAFATDFPWLDEEEGHMFVIGTCFLQGLIMTVDMDESKVLISKA